MESLDSLSSRPSETPANAHLVGDVTSSENIDHVFSVDTEAVVYLNEQQCMQLMKVLKSQREEGRFCDIIVQVNDSIGQAHYWAHRCVLAANSLYFHSILKSLSSAGQQQPDSCHIDTLQIETQDRRAFESLLDYMYTGQLSVSMRIVEELILLCEKLGIDDVRHCCNLHLEKNVDISNCFHLLDLSRTYKLKSLVSCVENFISENFNILSQSKELLLFEKEQLQRILSYANPESTVDTELYILRVIINWTLTDYNLRIDYYPEMLSLINTDRITKAGLANVFDDPHVRELRLLEHPASQNIWLKLSMSNKQRLLQATESAYLREKSAENYAQISNYADNSAHPSTSADTRIRKHEGSELRQKKFHTLTNLNIQGNTNNVNTYPEAAIQQIPNRSSNKYTDSEELASVGGQNQTTDITETIAFQNLNSDCVNIMNTAIETIVASDYDTGIDKTKTETNHKEIPAESDDLKIDLKYDPATSSRSKRKTSLPRKILQEDVMLISMVKNKRRGRTRKKVRSHVLPKPVATQRNLRKKTKVLAREETSSSKTSGQVVWEKSGDKDNGITTRGRKRTSERFQTKAHRDENREVDKNVDEEGTRLVKGRVTTDTNDEENEVAIKNEISDENKRISKKRATKDQAEKLEDEETVKDEDIKLAKVFATDALGEQVELEIRHGNSNGKKRIRGKRATQESEMYKCDKCDRRFYTPSALNHHRKGHGSDVPFLCEICGFSTKHYASITVHKRQHDGGKFRCPFPACTFMAIRRSRYEDHLNGHKGIKNHVCQVCGKAFSGRKHMQRHEKLHVDVKPFPCPDCQYRTTRRDKLKEHIKKHHPAAAVKLGYSEPGADQKPKKPKTVKELKSEKKQLVTGQQTPSSPKEVQAATMSVAMAPPLLCNASSVNDDMIQYLTAMAGNQSQTQLQVQQVQTANVFPAPTQVTIPQVAGPQAPPGCEQSVVTQVAAASNNGQDQSMWVYYFTQNTPT